MEDAVYLFLALGLFALLWLPFRRSGITAPPSPRP